MPQFPAGKPTPPTALGGRSVCQRLKKSRDIRTPVNGNGNRKPHKPQLFVCSYNVRTLKSQGDLQHLTHAVANIKHDIICLQETRRTRREDTRLPGYSLHIGASNRGQGGVGFLVKNHLSSWITTVEFISPRLGQLTLVDPNNKSMTIAVTTAYSPTELDPNDEINEFYSALDELLAKTKSFISITCGDFNGKLSPRISDDDKRIGPHSLHTSTSENGDRLVELIYRRRLYHCNSFFQKPPSRRWTWRSPNTTTFSEIDHILCNRIQIVSDISVVPYADAGSDHRLIRATVNLKSSTLKRATRTNTRSKKTGNLDVKVFQTILEATVPDGPFQCVEEEYDQTCKWIAQAHNSAAGHHLRKAVSAIAQMISGE